jgi:hypothetical protein
MICNDLMTVIAEYIDYDTFNQLLLTNKINSQLIKCFSTYDPKFIIPEIDVIVCDNNLYKINWDAISAEYMANHVTNYPNYWCDHWHEIRQDYYNYKKKSKSFSGITSKFMSEKKLLFVLTQNKIDHRKLIECYPRPAYQYDHLYSNQYNQFWYKTSLLTEFFIGSCCSGFYNAIKYMLTHKKFKKHIDVKSGNQLGLRTAIQFDHDGVIKYLLHNKNHYLGNHLLLSHLCNKKRYDIISIILDDHGYDLDDLDKNDIIYDNEFIGLLYKSRDIYNLLIQKIKDLHTTYLGKLLKIYKNDNNIIELLLEDHRTHKLAKKIYT